MLNADKALLSQNIRYQSSFTLISSWKKIFQILFAKVLKKSANYFYLLCRISSIYQEVYFPGSQLIKILNTQADLFICHQETGLLLGMQLIKKGKRVAFDFEDWYSEDYPNRFRSSDLFKQNEAAALRRAVYVTCPSESLSYAIRESYNIQLPVHVVYNTFPVAVIEKRKQGKSQSSMVWFSQTIGPNRGIEEFLKIIKTIDIPVELHFIGQSTQSYRSFLVDAIKETPHQICVHAPMRHNELLSFVGQFRIGLALENYLPKNKNLTISNKILLYLQLNMQVIATDTKGHLELAHTFPKSIVYINQADALQSRHSIKELITQSEFAVNNELNQYDWNEQEKKITALVAQSLNQEQ